jgi:hypothetical protein
MNGKNISDKNFLFISSSVKDLTKKEKRIRLSLSVPRNQFYSHESSITKGCAKLRDEIVKREIPATIMTFN